MSYRSTNSSSFKSIRLCLQDTKRLVIAGLAAESAAMSTFA